MKLARFRFQLLVLLVGQLLCRAWDLRELLAPDAPVVSVAVWEPSASSASAFLAVPRVWRDPRNRGDDQASAAASTGRGVEHTLTYHHDGPTLLAAPWPEPGHRRNSTGVRARRVSAPPRPFPRMDEQVLADRESLQSVTAVAVERGRGAARLWVLDTGEVPSHSLARCPPKVVVYNLRGNNQRVWTRPFDGVEGSAVSGLAVDAHAGDTRAYVGYPGAPGGSSLIVLSWRSKAFWLLRLHGVEAPLLPLQPKGPRGRRVPKPTGGGAAPSCWDLAVLKATGRRPRLALAPRSSRGVFDLGLEPLRATLDPERRNDAKGQASELGVRRLTNRPGPSCGLLADAQGGLLYFLVLADGGAVMRWSARSGASSQGHAVVYQDNATLPLSTALFLDTAGAAWAACATFALHHYRDPDLDSDPGVGEQSPNRRAHDDDVHGRSISEQDTDDGRDYDQDSDFDDDENLPRRCVCDDYDFDRNDGKDQSRRGDNRDRSVKNRGPGSNPSVLYDFRNSSKSSGKSENRPACSHIYRIPPRRHPLRNSCRYPRAAPSRTRAATTATERKKKNGNPEGRGRASNSWNSAEDDSDLHGPEPQEYVCMDPKGAADAENTEARSPCCSCCCCCKSCPGTNKDDTTRDDALLVDRPGRTMMVTRGTAPGRRGSSGESGPANSLRSVVMQPGTDDTDDLEANRPREGEGPRSVGPGPILGSQKPTVHCVRLVWESEKQEDSTKPRSS